MTTSTPTVGGLLALEQHAVGLADSGRGPQQDPVVAALSSAGPRSVWLTAPARPSQAPSRLWTTRSISLIPMNGAIIPPSAVDQQVPAQERGGADRPVAHAAQRKRDQKRDDERVEDHRRDDRRDSGVPRFMTLIVHSGPCSPGLAA